MNPDSSPDRSALAEGRSEAFAELYDRHAARMLAVARAITSSAPDAEEAVQQTALDLYRSRGALARAESPRAYLCRAVRNAARLGARARPAPPPEFRDRVVHWLQRARAHERRAWLAACAATLLVTCAARSTMPVLESGSSAPEYAVAPRELVELGFGAADAERTARVWSASRVPRIAPIQGCAPLELAEQGGS